MGLRKAERPMSEALVLAISANTFRASASGNRLNGGAFCRHPSADAFRPVYYHAQHRARQPHRASPLQIRHDATVIAGLWSLMSGTAVVVPLQALLGV
jgi:hypothetical protein